MSTASSDTHLKEIAFRIRDMREIMGFSKTEMAKRTGVTLEKYKAYERAEEDLPFTFIHKCALVLGIEITDLIEGHSAKLSSYTVTRRGQGRATAKEDGIMINNLAPSFRNKLAEPYWVRYEYSEKQQDEPIHLIKHSGQEFDIVLSGSLLVQVGEHQELLHEGDSIFYNSSMPHGMIATESRGCTFVAVVIAGDERHESASVKNPIQEKSGYPLLIEKFVQTEEDENGVVSKVNFSNTDSFNFGFDVVDAIADEYPDKTAMIHIDRELNERQFNFMDMKKESGRIANYFKNIGVKKGDRVMLVLKRHWQFWPIMIALHKLGAIAIPATYLLKEHDFIYRFQSAEVRTIVCTSDGDVAEIAKKAAESCPCVKDFVMVNGSREGWKNFDEEYKMYSSKFRRSDYTPCGDDPALMFFSSGTSGNPKMVEHSHTYPLGHFLTARNWHSCGRDGLHFTISDTGWAKSLWGKLYGQWMCEGAVFTYDFDRFRAEEIMPMFAKYGITTFCAPPTMLRMFIKEDLSKYDFSTVRHMTTAGEALNPEVFRQFEALTGLRAMEGFGQTETTLTVANFEGMDIKPGSMGKPSPEYDIVLVDKDDRLVAAGETGEIAIRLGEKRPVGLFSCYYKNEELTNYVMRNNMYHTGDTAWQDEDGYLWYVGRVDDIIKSSGYRIGPFEIESVIMELPYVLECGVSAAPDPLRGQIVKASIVLTKGTEGTEELKKEIQEYVKEHTAPYKYPRLVVFRDELPKTTNGKIQRNKL